MVHSAQFSCDISIPTLWLLWKKHWWKSEAAEKGIQMARTIGTYHMEAAFTTPVSVFDDLDLVQ